MHTKHEFKALGRDIVYLKEVATADLPEEVRAEAGDIETLFAVHNGLGEQVALVADPNVAAHLAQARSLRLVTVH